MARRIAKPTPAQGRLPKEAQEEIARVAAHMPFDRVFAEVDEQIATQRSARSKTPAEWITDLTTQLTKASDAQQEPDGESEYRDRLVKLAARAVAAVVDVDRYIDQVKGDRHA